MEICRHYAHTLDCPMHNNCPHEHFDIVTFVREEIECAMNGNQWPLSTFGPITNKPSLPNYIEDQSFEEIRFMYYESTKFPQSCRKYSNDIIESEEKVHSLMVMTNENIEDLCDLYDFDDETYEKPKFDNPFKKKNKFSAKKAVIGAAAGGFAGSSKKELQKVPLNEQQDFLDKQGLAEQKIKSAEVSPLQQTQQTDELKSDGLTSGISSQTSVEQKGCDDDDYKDLLNDLSLKINTISKTLEENEATTKVLQDLTMVNSTKNLDISQENNPQTKKFDPIKKDPSILIKPKRKQRSSQTQKSIMEHIDPIKLSIQINAIIRGYLGSIIIECKNDESVNKLQKHIELECGNHFDTEILYLSNPRIQISGIDYHIKKMKLIGVIKSQNKLNHELKLVYTFEEINDSSKYNALVEIDEELYQKLFEDKDPYFNIGWRRCNVYDNVDAKRCNKCWGFNHTANDCLDNPYIPKRRVPLEE